MEELILNTHCCEDMAYHVDFECDVHSNPFDCPDKLVIYDKEGNDYALIIHDGGTATISICYCPWCGTALNKK